VRTPPGPRPGAAVANVQVSQAPAAEGFTTVALAGPFAAPAAIARGDVDDDGHADLVAADSGLNQLLVYNGDGAGHFTRSTFDLAPFGAGATALAAAPLTTDSSHDDVAVALSQSARV